MNKKSPKASKTSVSHNLLQIILGIIISVVVAGLVGFTVIFIISHHSQPNLLDNPSINNIKTVISKIDSIDKVCIVTEDNDINGNLNKDGGYIEALFFVSSYAQDYGVTSDDACANGTNAGGSIEIYQSARDAKARDDYLASFDGKWGLLRPGAHKVFGRIVVRISDYMSASKQTELLNSIEFTLKNNKGA